MSPFARVAEDATRVDDMLAAGKLNSASIALDVMGGAIKAMSPERGAATFKHCCTEWLARVVRLAEAKWTCRPPEPNEWPAWFAEAQANIEASKRRQIQREIELAERALNS